ncbi:hypothetical protein BDU57DRAFT_551611 [Ampelomyces quisqualis]|uniref:Uncharacterized protein n=1 Tax=Ampelomyces quisqualis TaxID=50730 RepID=A0A6A5Q9K1_AMPQU|nr:hypothetical protein BDU57DRAFT_551611 [Ampelomyces quisqualis]
MLAHLSLWDQAMRTHALFRAQQARVAALQKDMQALQEDLKASSSREQDAFEALAKAECTQLCNRIMTQLPREVRDMIAQHLTTKPNERINRDYFRSTTDPTTKLHTHDPTRWKATHYPAHFWDPAYVGTALYTELAENYYHTSTFTFGDDDGLMARFLSTDLMNTGYVPKELVSAIQVDLNAMTYDRSSCIGYMFGCATKPERLAAALDGVRDVRPGTRVVVRFWTQAKDEVQREEQVLTAWTVVGPVLREAKGRGCVVRMVIDGDVDVDVDVDVGVDGGDGGDGRCVASV